MQERRNLILTKMARYKINQPQSPCRLISRPDFWLKMQAYLRSRWQGLQEGAENFSVMLYTLGRHYLTIFRNSCKYRIFLVRVTSYIMFHAAVPPSLFCTSILKGAAALSYNRTAKVKNKADTGALSRKYAHSRPKLIPIAIKMTLFRTLLSPRTISLRRCKYAPGQNSSIPSRPSAETPPHRFGWSFAQG